MKSNQKKDSFRQVSSAGAMKSGHESEVRAGGFAPIQAKRNQTGLPDNLKAGIENLSGHSMDDVKVHYNSSQPAPLQAHAYAQGTDIHVAPGQERHLPHEAWHVVQQKQGRVKPTRQLKGKTPVNENAGLEQEADRMGARAIQENPSFAQHVELVQRKVSEPVSQRRIIYGGASESVVASDDDEMLEFLVGRFGEARREYLQNMLDHERGRPRRITAHQFYQAILGAISSQVEEVAPSESGGPRMPEDIQQIKDFAVTEGTKLLGMAGRFAIPLLTNIKRGKHAEKLFVDRVEELHSQNKINLKKNPEITITINNSPCNKRCAKMLAKWVRKHKLTGVTIYFANPHGFDDSADDDNFSDSRRILREAGIRLTPFEPRSYMSREGRNFLSRGRGKEWNQRYDGMSSRRSRASAMGRFDSSSEESSSSEEEESRSRSRSRSPKKIVAKRKPSRSSSPVKKESRKDKAADKSGASGRQASRLPGTLRNVSGDGMDCLIRATLLAVQGAVNEDRVAIIRQHLVEQGVAEEDEMLDLVGAAGAIMIAFMVGQHIMPANRGIVVYTPARRYVIIGGDNPINLWLDDDHFQAII